MTFDFDGPLGLYFKGVLGPGMVLSVHVLFAYLLSFAVTVCVGLLSYSACVKPFGTGALATVCLVPAVLVSALLLAGFLSNDIDVVEVSFFMMFLAPATWLLPVMAAYYLGSMVFKSDRQHKTHKVGYGVVLTAEVLAILLFVPWFL